MVADYILTGGVSYNTTAHKFPISNFWNSIKKGFKTALFMEALRNLAWSRGYLWYCEMDGVPNPFQRGGVLGLPCKSITYRLGNGETMDTNTSTIDFAVPQRYGSIGDISLDLYEDEQGTLTTFFERWYNEIYNVHYGVLPITECCKQLSIYRQKASRRNQVRVYYDLDRSVSGLRGTISNLVKGEELPKSTDGLELLVYPAGEFSVTLNTDSNDILTINVKLQVADILNMDFGNPCFAQGQKSIFGIALGDITNGDSWWDKIADYI